MAGLHADWTAGAADTVTMAGEVGHPPADFRTDRTGKGATGQWTIVFDSTTEGGRALAQLSPDPTDYRFPLAIYEPISATNVDVTVRFKAVDGRVDRAAGIAVRLTDADNYYVARANALEDNVNFYRVVKGVRQQIHGVRTKVTSDEWHTLGIRATGNRFAIMFDGRTLFTADDSTFPGSGQVGLWTKADSITHFDNLTIHKLP
jgi:hypothetical protein